MIRLQDIAEMAGVSRTTVLNVINGNTKRVSQKTIDKITAILKEQNYVPHMRSQETERRVNSSQSCITILSVQCLYRSR